MTTDEDIKTIIAQPQPAESLMLRVVERYIKDLKDTEVVINNPNSVTDKHLLFKAYSYAKAHYEKHFKKKDENVNGGSI